jgi:hypothetical protein
MPFVARELEVIYGTRHVGGATDLLMDGELRIKLSNDYQRASISFGFYATATTGPAFDTLVKAIEDDFRIPRQAIRVLHSGTDLIGASGFGLDPAQNTGFWANPVIRKLGDKGDTVRTRHYEVTIDAQRPADLTGQSGRLNSNINLETSPSGRLTLTVTGSYTALGANKSRAQFNAAIGAYFTGLANTLIGTNKWETINTPVAESDDMDANLRFTRIARELLLNQNATQLDDPNITDSVLRVSRMRLAPGDTKQVGNPARLQEIRIAYTAWIDKSVTDIAGYWESTIKPWLMSHALAVTGATQPALVNEPVDFDYTDRRVSANLSVLAPNGSNLISATVTTTDDEDRGIRPVAVWSGDVHAKHLFQGPATRGRTVVSIVRTLAAATSGASGPVAGGAVGGQSLGPLESILKNELGGFAIDSALQFSFIDPGQGGQGNAGQAGGNTTPQPAQPVGGSSAGFVLLGQSVQRTPLTLGLAPFQLDVVDQVTTQRYIYRTAPKTGGG